MRADEAFVLRGAERFARTAGYGWSLEYAGRFDDPCPRRPDGSADVELVAIDAIDYRSGDASGQYQEATLLRELAKARCGFRRDGRNLPVATGNWGCGAFRGDPVLKAVVQWLAASAEGRAMRYHPFGNHDLAGLASFATQAATRFGSVGALWSRLRTVAGGGSGPALFGRILAG
jgi:poly(ADP-ribose) glycohydrolase